MLGKRIKWELKAALRFIPWIWLGSLSAGLLIYLLIKIGGWISNENFIGPGASLLLMIGTMIIGLSFIAIMASFVISMYYPLIRYYKTTVSDEAYLTFTLPISRSSHMLTQIIASLILSVGGAIVCFISFIIAVGLENIYNFIKLIIPTFEGINIGALIAIFIIAFVLLISSFLYSQLLYFAGLTLGQRLLKNKIGGAILGCVIMYFASQLVTSIGSFIVMMIISIINTNVTDSGVGTVIGLEVGFLIFYASLDALLYFLTLNSLKNHYNLE